MSISLSANISATAIPEYFFLVSMRLRELLASYAQDFFSATRIDRQSDGSIEKIRVGVMADKEKDKWQKDKE
jgi:hypothetical protein